MSLHKDLEPGAGSNQESGAEVLRCHMPSTDAVKQALRLDTNTLVFSGGNLSPMQTDVLIIELSTRLARQTLSPQGLINDVSNAIHVANQKLGLKNEEEVPYSLGLFLAILDLLRGSSAELQQNTAFFNAVTVVIMNLFNS